jgi:hypothetical protein
MKRTIDAALDKALEQHPRFADATITRTCDECGGEGVINYQEGIWHPELGRHIVETRPTDCFICSGTGKIKVTPSGAELLDRACKSVGLGR